MKKLAITFLTCLVAACCAAQDSTVSIRLVCGIPLPPPCAEIDFIKFDSMPNNLIQQNEQFFKHAKIKGYPKEGRVVIKTKMYIVIDERILYTTEQKREFLSGITEDEIAEIQFLDRKATAKTFGLKSKHGTMFIKTKDGSYSFHKCNPDSIERTVKKRQVSDFKRFPAELLNDLDKMGVDSSSMLNDYEAKYLNFIFAVTPEEFDFAGKRVGFLSNKTTIRDYTGKTIGFRGCKEYFFGYERLVSRDSRNYRGILASGCGFRNCNLYILNASQKEESGGYDAAIVYQNNIIPIEAVVRRLKKK